MKHLTVRKLPDDVAAALEREKKARGKSLNQTVIELLEQSLGVGDAIRRHNGLRRWAGSWSEDDYREFDEATASTRQVDGEIWR